MDVPIGMPTDARCVHAFTRLQSASIDLFAHPPNFPFATPAFREAQQIERHVPEIPLCAWCGRSRLSLGQEASMLWLVLEIGWVQGL